MKFLFVFLILMLGQPSSAGFNAYNQNQNLGVYSGFKCSSGTSCTVQKGTLVMVASPNVTGILQPQTAATFTTITAAQCGSTFYNTGVVQLDLPEASTAIGCRLTFVVISPSNFDINPENADKIEGLTNTAGDMIRSATPGTTVTLQAVSSTQWMVVSMYNTWTDAD